MTAPLLEIDRVEKTFHGDGGVEVQALRPTDLAVRGGEFVSVTGPSGCGKSTLFNIIGGLLPYEDLSTVAGGADRSRYALGLGVTIIGVLLAEIKLSNVGLGFLAIEYYNAFQIERMYVVLIIIFIVAVLINSLMTLLSEKHDRA